MNCGRYSSDAKNTAEISSTARHAVAKLRLAITSRGISAASPMRRSIAPKPTSITAQIASNATMRGSPQPQSVAWSSATSSATRPSASVDTPA